MKNIFKQFNFWLLAIIITLSCCTDNFEKFNTDNSGYPEDLQEYDFNKWGIPLTIVQKGIYFNYNWGGGTNWTFQIMQNLNADMFSGYFHDCAQRLFSINSVYNLDEGWTSSYWINTYGYIMPVIYESEIRTEEDGFPAFLGITKILKVATMHRIADQYGPLVYSKFGSKTGSDPESLEEAYVNFFDDLEKGISLIKKWANENPNSESFYKFDILTKTKSYDEWLRFANSLRLRLAIRISNVDKQMADVQIKKCFEPEHSFLEIGNHLIAVATQGSGYTNPLGEINQGWNEAYMNASMESFLTGYNDPRISKYFIPAEGKGNYNYLFPIEGTFKGIRQGINVGHQNYDNHSKCTILKSTPAILVTPAEVWFLRAEAALRGFTAESVQQCYENGVKASFSQWDINSEEVQSYLNNEALPADFLDTFDPSFNVPATTDITPKWEENVSKERKLERIITQKWIACYPEGVEAWTEQRRTGYPKLFKVFINNSQGTIDTDIMIRRLPFPATLAEDDNDQYSKLINLLDGPNTGGSRLWWDTGHNNF